MARAAVPLPADGAMEEGAPMIAPRRRRQRVSFVAKPRRHVLDHTHAVAKTDLTRSLYSGQYGFLRDPAGAKPRRL